MQVITNPAEMAAIARENRCGGKTIGFVPTMGYLHEGHLSLVRAAKAVNDVVALSIFVNPTQFGAGEDLDRYPRDIDGDMEKCRRNDVHYLFIPKAQDMYPEGHSTSVDVGRLSEALCGASRPGHFRGVATVVAKLLNIVRPHRVYLGLKDYQQTVLVGRLVRDLNFDTEVVTCPTVREPDGLAMSSRNAYLSQEERVAAAQIYRALASARSLRASGEVRADALVGRVRDSLAQEGRIKVEYIELVDSGDLRPLTRAGEKAVLALAVRIGKTRLIDNTLL